MASLDVDGDGSEDAHRLAATSALGTCYGEDAERFRRRWYDASRPTQDCDVEMNLASAAARRRATADQARWCWARVAKE
jgi:hypothetical protein